MPPPPPPRRRCPARAYRPPHLACGVDQKADRLDWNHLRPHPGNTPHHLLFSCLPPGVSPFIFSLPPPALSTCTYHSTTAHCGLRLQPTSAWLGSSSVQLSPAQSITTSPQSLHLSTPVRVPLEVCLSRSNLCSQLGPYILFRCRPFPFPSMARAPRLLLRRRRSAAPPQAYSNSPAGQTRPEPALLSVRMFTAGGLRLLAMRWARPALCPVPDIRTAEAEVLLLPPSATTTLLPTTATTLTLPCLIAPPTSTYTSTSPTAPVPVSRPCFLVPFRLCFG